MNKMFKRMTALALMLVMVLSMTAHGEAAFDPKSVCEGVKITIAVPADDEVIDWDTNALTLYIEESLGVDLEAARFPFFQNIHRRMVSPL